MKIRSLITSLLLISMSAAPALAGTPQPLGTFGFWRAFQVTENNQPVCYMSLTGPAPQPAPAAPVKKGQTTPPKRGDVVLMITHRPAEGSKDVVSYSAGLKFKNASEAKIKIGEKEFGLFTQNDTAWSRDAATDHALTAAVRDAQALTMIGESAKGEQLADMVKLKGADQAYVAMSKACGISAEPLKQAAPAAKAAKPAKKH